MKICIFLLILLLNFIVAAAENSNCELLNFLGYQDGIRSSNQKSAYTEYLKLEEMSGFLHDYSETLTERGPNQAEAGKLADAYQALSRRRVAASVRLLDTCPKDRFLLKRGTVVQPDNAIFNRFFVNLGYDDPAEFQKRVNSWIYFLDPFQPGKPVVLFVHGHGGSAANFDFINRNIDKTRFQAWAYFYPSGEPVRDTAYRLLTELRTCKEKYHFGDIYIVAHSLGGVVTRTMLSMGQEANPIPGLKGVLTIASPNKGIVATVPYDALCQLVFNHFDHSIEELYVNSPLMQQMNGHQVPGVRFISCVGNHPKTPNFEATSKLIGGTNDGLIRLENASIFESCDFVEDEDHATILQSQRVVQAINSF
ncbi:MAG: hypothetical protein PHW04_01795 [Candidatus Wallbacteria bacterium]|nr:hypothetical protein [Candidatus Wallbacteria bacterium]